MLCSASSIAYKMSKIYLLWALEKRVGARYDQKMSGNKSKACAIIVAGGQGSRARRETFQSEDRADLPKQLQILGGKSVLAWSLDVFSRHGRMSDLIIVCPDSLKDEIVAIGLPPHVHFAQSGLTRTASVRSGLEAAAKLTPKYVFIHDAARPGLNQATLDALFVALDQGVDGVAPARPVADALWHTDKGSFSQAQSRDGLMRVQTPQAFVYTAIKGAYDALAPDQEMADDIAVARLAGLVVVPISGSERLDKITWPEDFARMSNLLIPALFPRIGTGFDAHRFADGKGHVSLCGILIAHEKGLAGHSDADVGWHALCDAIYGALGAGDIGHHFPPSDAQWKGAASSVFLRHAGDLVRQSGGVIQHVDVTLICEAPKVGPHREAMRAATSDVLGIGVDRVSIKATTTEGMGFTGRREGIAAQACATILMPNSPKATEAPL
jgi:2-C-methyl-D-erythritol 4-phosphate cytidylyltransferase / 2-C-methyl-D-erythritol 2,4-cyclodiphosphate synthase